MADTNIPGTETGSNIRGAYDLADDETDNEINGNMSKYPEKNTNGHRLFDANGNSYVPPEEREEMIKQVEQKFIEIFELLRISRRDPNSTNTPLRLSKMLVNELLTGRYDAPPKMTVFPNRKNVDELIISKGIEVMSMCSHHWQPITGRCSIGYIPGKYVIGLSKLTRIVNWFARRGQIQEELGEQIADFLEGILKPQALGVVIKARHYCMIARGVKSSEEKSMMVTSVMRGLLLEEMNLRNEFLKLIEDDGKL